MSRPASRPRAAVRRASRALGPMAATWAVALGVHGLHVLHLREWLAAPALVTAAFAPLLLLDTWASARLEGVTVRSLWSTPGRARRGAAGNLVLWSVAFVGWVLGMGQLADVAPFLRWFGPEFYYQFWLVYAAQGWLTWLALAIWLLLYATIAVNRGRARILISIGVPGLLTVALFAHLTFLGGVGAESLDTVLEQPGVSLELDPHTLAIAGDAPRPGASLTPTTPIECVEATATEPIPRTIPYRFHPRDVLPDATGDVLYLSYGCSWCVEEGTTPSVLRLDRRSGDVTCFKSSNLHHVGYRTGDELVWAAPWSSHEVVGLSSEDLSVVARVRRPRRRDLRFFQPIQVLPDINGGRLYAGTELEATLVAFDTSGDAGPQFLRLPETGLVRWGGPLHFLTQHPTTRRLYFTSGPGHNLFEADPDTLELLRSVDLGDVVGTALLLDAEADVIYYQSGVRDALFRVPLDTFEPDRTYEGEIHARRLAHDPDRGLLYVLGHFSGRVFALDLESGDRVFEVAVGGRPHGLARHGHSLFVNTFLGVLRIPVPTVLPR